MGKLGLVILSWLQLYDTIRNMEERKIIANCGAVIIEDRKILLVQEAAEPFKGRWNFPLGQLESNELVLETVKREVKEETGFDIGLDGFLGVYQSMAPGLNVILIMFTAHTTGGTPDFDKEELLGSKWFTLEEFDNLEDGDLFHPEMRNAVKKALENTLPLNSYSNF